MDEPLIKSVNQTARVKDLVKKSGRKPKAKPERDNKQSQKKDSKRIIDTYA